MVSGLIQSCLTRLHKQNQKLLHQAAVTFWYNIELFGFCLKMTGAVVIVFRLLRKTLKKFLQSQAHLGFFKASWSVDCRLSHCCRRGCRLRPPAADEPFSYDSEQQQRVEECLQPAGQMKTFDIHKHFRSETALLLLKLF